MSPTPDRLERIRTRLATTIHRANDLLTDVKALPDSFALLMPSLAQVSDDERATSVARLCGYDEKLPEKLHALVEGLADTLAGLTTADSGRAWLAQQLSTLEWGDDD